MSKVTCYRIKDLNTGSYWHPWRAWCEDTRGKIYTKINHASCAYGYIAPHWKVRRAIVIVDQDDQIVRYLA